MATKRQLEKEINAYKGKIVTIQKEIFEYQKAGKPERDYCQLMSEEQFLGSLIMLNKERLEKLVTTSF